MELGRGGDLRGVDGAFYDWSKVMNALFAAMAKAFPEIEGASKDKNNPAFKSKYADLTSVSDAIKPALVKHGLFYSQITHEQAGGVCVETILCHESGESFSFGKLFVPAGKQDAQGYGSALTYARRYSLMTAFGVCPEDDDGNAASQLRKVDPAPTGEVISKAQVSELQALAGEVGADVRKFCGYMKVPSLADLPSNQFARAKSALEAKRKPADERIAA
jgi:hypothetical protein